MTSKKHGVRGHYRRLDSGGVTYVQAHERYNPGEAEDIEVCRQQGLEPIERGSSLGTENRRLETEARRLENLRLAEIREEGKREKKEKEAALRAAFERRRAEMEADPKAYLKMHTKVEPMDRPMRPGSVAMRPGRPMTEEMKQRLKVVRRNQ